MAKAVQNKITKQAAASYKNLMRALAEVSIAATEMTRLLEAGLMDQPGHMIDTAYILKLCAETSESLEKVFMGLRRMTAKRYCIWLVEQRMSGLSEKQLKELLRGRLATATIKQTQCFNLPTDKDANYRDLLLYLGASEDAIDHGLLEPRWRHTMDFLTRQLATGAPLPKALENANSFIEYDLSLRRNKGADVGAFADNVE